MRKLIYGIAALTAGLGALAMTGAAQAAPARFTPGACVGDFTGVDRKVDCGILSVDETRGGKGNRRVAMPVTIVRASAPKPGATPVIFLHGGPGGASVEGVARRIRGVAGRELMAIDQDWIFFDQRGGGLSSPALDCGTSPFNDAGPLTDAAAASLVACAQRLVAAGIDLSRYNAVEVAKDIQDLRQTLGLKQVNLMGGSYGTRIALAVVKHDPQEIRAVVLDSPWTPEATWAEGGPEMVSDAVREIFKRCALDKACTEKYGATQAQFDTLAAKWLTGPQTLKGKTYRADDLGGFLMDAAYSASAARALPATLARFVAGDMTELDAHIADRSGYAEAQHMTHLCKEEFPFESADRMRVGAKRDPVSGLLASSMGRYFEVCKAFPVGAPNPLEAQPVSSDVPALFLAAEIDPGCPPAVARAAVGRFPKGQLTIVPNTTHGVSGGSACARKMIRAFLIDPTAPIDETCLHPEHDRFVFNLD